jgi:hypothetical protein
MGNYEFVGAKIQKQSCPPLKRGIFSAGYKVQSSSVTYGDTSPKGGQNIE